MFYVECVFSFVQVSFNQQYDLTWARFMQRYNVATQNKDIRLEYENGRSQDVCIIFFHWKILLLSLCMTGLSLWRIDAHHMDLLLLTCSIDFVYTVICHFKRRFVSMWYIFYHLKFWKVSEYGLYQDKSHKEKIQFHSVTQVYVSKGAYS